MGSRKALKFFSAQCCDETPALHLVLQLRIPVVSYKLVLPSTDGISLVVPCTPGTNHRDNSSLLLHPPVASFQAVQDTHFPGLSIPPVWHCSLSTRAAFPW